MSLMIHRVAQPVHKHNKKKKKTINEPAGDKWGLKTRQRANLIIQVLPKQRGV